MEKKVAIVYDWLDKWGGVERVLLNLHELYPQADWYTSYYDKKGASWAKNLSVTTSFIQKLPGFIKKSRLLSFPLYPYAFESFNFNGYDLVISVTSSFAKGIITKPETKHICYLLTPTRYLWGMTDDYVSDGVALPFINSMREWDFVAAQRPDRIISISKTVAERCKKYYKRDSEVVYPPFDLDYWKNIQPSQAAVDRVLQARHGSQSHGKYFLVVSRLEPYKKVDLVIKAFKQLPNSQLVIVGEGTEKAELQKLAGPNVQFTGTVTDAELAGLYLQSEALIMPQEEDFGYVALEAQALGRPVIAYAKGGAVETVAEGKTGLFFNEQTVGSLLNILQSYHTISYEFPAQLEQFSRAQFQSKFSNFL